MVALDGLISGKVACCKKDCIKKLSRSELIKTRNMFVSKQKPNQKQYVLDYLSSHSGQDGTINFTIGKVDICCSGWRMVHGVSRSR